MKRFDDDVVVENATGGVGVAIEPPHEKVVRDEDENHTQPTEETALPIEQKGRQCELKMEQHPHLEDLYVMNAHERIVPNSTSVDIDNDLFRGKMLLMFRTGDADDEVDGTDPYASHFRGKDRRFEFQWQLQLKQLPQGDVYISTEVEEPVQMGMIQRAVANAALAFVQKMNYGFSYHISESPDAPSYSSFPVGTAMDRFVATEVGDELPVLGEEIVEDRESMRQRLSGEKIEWRTDRVYTMALWSACVDWRDWSMNFPGIPPVSLTNMVGVQPIHFRLYTTCSLTAETSVEMFERSIVLEIEVSNSANAVLGREAKKWAESNGSASDETATIAADCNNRFMSEGTEAGESSDVGSLHDDDGVCGNGDEE